MRIAIFAGLGNQLFQFSYAHGVSKLRGEHIELAVEDNPQVDRDYALESVLSSCSHVKSVRKTNIREMKGFSRLTRISQFLFSTKLGIIPKTFPIAYELKPYNFDLSQYINDKLNVGYYQHWKYVEDSWPEIGDEIFRALSKFQYKIDEIGDLANTATFHIRRGDLIQSASTMGILCEEYYLKIANRLRENDANITIQCITDDVENSRDLIKKLAPERFFGPDELGTWESLALMSRSKIVVAANSTFSWWGAFICHKMGGVAILPTPWFKDWHQEIGDAFYFPGSTTENSNFMEDAF
jgi:Glycosyl transferase family 11